MAVIHIDIKSITDSALESTIKINGTVVNKTYFTRGIVKVTPLPKLNCILVVLPNTEGYTITHNQENESGDIYIVDTVNDVAPESLLDLAFKLASLIK